MTSAALRTPLCDLLGIEVPILQAGMGRTSGTVTPPPLVAAVSAAGGLGCLGAAGMSPDEIRGAVAEIRRLTDRPFAVGLLIPASLSAAEVRREDVRRDVERRFPEQWRLVQELYAHYGLDPDVRPPHEQTLGPELIRAQIDVLLAERVPAIVAGLGDPSWVVPLARDAGIVTMGIAGSVRHAERQRASGVDVVIAQGAEAGGHTGTVSTLPLVPQVVDAARPTPVVAAGGIADGRGIAAALALGAEGAWIGTAFLFAQEANVADAQRRRLSEVGSHELCVSRAFTGKPSRIVPNEVADRWAAAACGPLPMPHQMVIMDDFTVAAEAAGRWDLVSSPAGQAVGLLAAHEPAADIVHRLRREAVEAIDRLAARGGRTGAFADA